jgi:hypothetical protein
MTPEEIEQVHANINKLMAETMKLSAETSKLNAESMKLYAESGKLTKEIFWYPMAIATGLVIAVATFTGVVIKLLSVAHVW